MILCVQVVEGRGPTCIFEMIPNTLSRDSVAAFIGELFEFSIGEFDLGSGRTLAACLTHASHGGSQEQPANGCVTREQSADFWGIAGPTAG